MNFFQKHLSFPCWCYHCQKFQLEPQEGNRLLCVPCSRQLPWIDQENCTVCGKGHNDKDCPLKWVRPIDRFYSVFRYEAPVSSWISRLKHRRDLLSGRVIRGLLSQWALKQALPLEHYDYIVPMPIHWKRLLVRGFNQTDYLVQQLPGIMVNRKILKKKRSFPRQTALTGKARLRNLSDGFLVDQAACKGKKVLLFDDVCTTGRTISVAAQSLKKAGAAEVSALILCRNL